MKKQRKLMQFAAVVFIVVAMLTGMVNPAFAIENTETAETAVTEIGG